MFIIYTQRFQSYFDDIFNGYLKEKLFNLSFYGSWKDHNFEKLWLLKIKTVFSYRYTKYTRQKYMPIASLSLTYISMTSHGTDQSSGDIHMFHCAVVHVRKILL